MSVALLDVNMLVALAWPTHVHHGTAHAWFHEHHEAGWATCPMTQCAFVRVSSNPRILPDAVEPLEANTLLRRMMAYGHHVFWPDSVPLHDSPVPVAMLSGHRQVTDAYLLGLAMHHGGRLVTLDTGLRALVPGVSGAAEALDVVPVR